VTFLVELPLVVIHRQFLELRFLRRSDTMCGTLLRLSIWTQVWIPS
jgi:hypothetical protein